MKRLGLAILSVSILLVTALVHSGCEQSDPDFENRTEDTLSFAGKQWEIKITNGLQGPGPNYFSGHPNDVWVDNEGFLHLTVSKRSGEWKCTEVVCKENTGYGTYVFTIEGDPVNIDEQIVLGLFTWDNNTFQEEANSEADIEFAKWQDPEEGYTLQYGVQPIAFGPYNEERVYKPAVDSLQWIGISTHAFTWTDSLITWESWPGAEYGNGEPTASWTFDLNNPAKIKYEGPNQSDPIIIPAPGETTNARMNLWLVNGPEGPTNEAEHEIIIRDYQYIPL